MQPQHARVNPACPPGTCRPPHAPACTLARHLPAAPLPSPHHPQVVGTLLRMHLNGARIGGDSTLQVGAAGPGRVRAGVEAVRSSRQLQLRRLCLKLRGRYALGACAQPQRHARPHSAPLL